jgi:phospholipase/carboxylesterase
MTLTGPRTEPAYGGPARNIVLFLHGLGADGNDLMGLAPHLAPLFPDTLFVAPNAPFACDMAPSGFQWFSLNEASPASIAEGVRAAAPALDKTIDDLLAETGLQPSDLALFGFSQGSMMALHTALRRPEPMAGVASFSGALIDPESLQTEIKSKPPVLLVHGDADQIVPPQALTGAQSVLEALGVPVAAVMRPDLEHGIDGEGVQAGASFLKQIFG